MEEVSLDVPVSLGESGNLNMRIHKNKARADHLVILLKSQQNYLHLHHYLHSLALLI